LELKKANEAINKGKQSGNGLEYDPFAEEERRPTPAVPSHPAVTKAKVRFLVEIIIKMQADDRSMRLISHRVVEDPLHVKPSWFKISLVRQCTPVAVVAAVKPKSQGLRRKKLLRRHLVEKSKLQEP
jgi:hypothetical protein